MKPVCSHYHDRSDQSPFVKKQTHNNLYRFMVYTSILLSTTLIALVFYGLFKPSDVILNRLMAKVVSISPILTEHNNLFIDTFIQTFGDFLSVVMVFMFLGIMITLLRFPVHETKFLFQWMIVPFIVFECLQLLGIGNFYIRDLIAYSLGYQLGFYIITRIENISFKSLFTIIYTSISQYIGRLYHG